MTCQAHAWPVYKITNTWKGRFHSRVDDSAGGVHVDAMERPKLVGGRASLSSVYAVQSCSALDCVPRGLDRSERLGVTSQERQVSLGGSARVLDRGRLRVETKPRGRNLGCGHWFRVGVRCDGRLWHRLLQGVWRNRPAPLSTPQAPHSAPKPRDEQRKVEAALRSSAKPFVTVARWVR